MMFEILFYLFENYYDADNFPDQDTLSRKLTAVGFDHDDIGQALDWLTGLGSVGDSSFSEALSTSTGFRHFSAVEAKKLSLESRGFLIFLENAEVLAPHQRELIIDRVLALDESEVGLEKVKLIVLMVLASQKQTLDSLILEELLFSHNDRYIH